MNGRLDILKCAVVFGIEMSSVFDYDDHYNELKLIEKVIVETVENGHLDIIEYLHDQGVDLNEVIECIDDDEFRRMKAINLHSMVSTGIIEDWTKEHIVHHLAIDGETDILKKCYTKYINSDSLFAFAEAGNFEAINWLLQENDFDFEWTFDLFWKSAKGGSIPIMELCLQNNCPNHDSICVSAMQNKNKEVALTALKWLREHNIRWDERELESLKVGER